jgi:HrpA-like RNA helicase
MHLQEELLATKPGRPNSRKVVVATQYAESSVDISDVVYVVDCGLYKTRVFDPKTACDAVVVAPTTMTTARLRGSRAGRAKPGKCFRLYTENALKSSGMDCVEIEKVDITPLLLCLKSVGINNLLSFDYPTLPSYAQFDYALTSLLDLGLMADSGLTSNATLVTDLPMDVYLATMVANSIQFGCMDEIMTIVAMTLQQSVFIDSGQQSKLSVAKFAVKEGDFVSMVNGIPV